MSGTYWYCCINLYLYACQIFCNIMSFVYVNLLQNSYRMNRRQDHQAFYNFEKYSKKLAYSINIFNMSLQCFGASVIWHHSAYKSAKDYEFYLSWWYLGPLMLTIRIGYYLFIVNIFLISLVIYCV